MDIVECRVTVDPSIGGNVVVFRFMVPVNTTQETRDWLTQQMTDFSRYLQHNLEGRMP